MRLETLTRAAAVELPPDPKEVRTEVAGGKVTLTYHPVRAREAVGSPGERLEAAVLAWDVTDENGDVLPVNADSIHALSPSVKDALLAAIHPAKGKAAPKAEEKPSEAHGSFETAEKEAPRGSK